MKILITGGTGLLGKGLVRRLLGSFPLRMISRSRDKTRFAEAMGIEVFYGDLRDRDFACKAIRGVDCVVHLAAVFDPAVALKDNVAFMQNVIAACRNNRVGKVIFMSSINSRFKKQGPYSLSKKICEEELSLSGLDYCILRPTLIYDDSGGIFLGQLLKLVKQFHVAPVIGTGEYRIQPIHADDVIAVIEKVLSSHKEKVYDLFGPEILTYNSLAEMIFSKIGIKKGIKIHIPINLLKLIGPFLGVTSDKILEIEEDRTGDPEIIRNEFTIPLVDLRTRLGIIIQNIR